MRTELGRFGRQISGYALEHLLPERGFDVSKALVDSEGTPALTLAAQVLLVHVRQTLVICSGRPIPALKELPVSSVDYSPEFDWTSLSVPEPMAMVRAQLGFSWLMLAERLGEIDDEAYLWEPAPGAWSLRPRDKATATATAAIGLGDWVMEWPREGDPERMRTIAWLVSHLTEVFFERWEWTFGGHKLRRDDLTFAPTAAEGVDQLRRWAAAWQKDIAALEPADVFTVGLSQAPEIDQEAPFGHLVLHVNRELIHHGAEITFLLDLHSAQPTR